MMHKVKIEVRNSRIDEEPIEVVYIGIREDIENGARITYEESVLTGMEGVHTRLDIGEKEIVLVRTGTIQSRMVFRENYRDSFLYHMEVGSMSMVLETEKIKIVEEPGRMDVYIRYKLEIAGESFERNEMSIRVMKSGHSEKLS